MTAQDKWEAWSAPRKTTHCVQIGYGINTFGVIDISVLREWTKLEQSSFSKYGPSVGVEMRFNPNHFAMAPKIAFEWHYLLFASRLNALLYTNLAENGLIIRPEIGASLFGKGYIMYGYNFSVVGKDSYPLTHNVIFGVNLAWHTKKSK